jgi:hypothetical protein
MLFSPEATPPGIIPVPAVVTFFADAFFCTADLRSLDKSMAGLSFPLRG